MKNCEMIGRKLCLGCTGLAEDDWIGKEKCKEYQKLSKMSGLEICKKIIEGVQMKI